MTATPEDALPREGADSVAGSYPQAVDLPGQYTACSGARPAVRSPRPERRRFLVIFNPTAGRRSRARLHATLAALARLGVATVVRETAEPGEAEVFARAASPADFDAIAVAGGDGTLNEVVNGLRHSSLPLAIFPFGTGNVLAQEIDLPRQPARLAEIAANGPARPIWLGEVLSSGEPPRVRRFVLMAGIGFDAGVVDGLDLALKRRAGKLAFVWSIARQLWLYRPARYDIVIENGGPPQTFRPASAVATKGHFYAGRFVLAPKARLSDPVFHVVMFMRTGRWAALCYLAALTLGFLHRLPGVTTVAAHEARFTGPAGAPVQIDGDILARQPATLRIAEQPILLIHPAG